MQRWRAIRVGAGDVFFHACDCGVGGRLTRVGLGVHCTGSCPRTGKQNKQINKWFNYRCGACFSTNEVFALVVSHQEVTCVWLNSAGQLTFVMFQDKNAKLGEMAEKLGSHESNLRKLKQLKQQNVAILDGLIAELDALGNSSTIVAAAEEKQSPPSSGELSPTSKQQETKQRSRSVISMSGHQKSVLKNIIGRKSILNKQ